MRRPFFWCRPEPSASTSVFSASRHHSASARRAWADFLDTVAFVAEDMSPELCGERGLLCEPEQGCSTCLRQRGLAFASANPPSAVRVV
mmetsp:Transcript_58639/g.188573  ORF Transcript_58639/g.188573 Transcript_58639/m.188573 type:complete len:89 (+) Transcript_58639:1285-1551(+)